MQIVHIAAEMAGLAKIGGLGDMVSGLSKNLSLQGHRVTVFLPRYKKINLKNLLEETCTMNGLSFKAYSYFLENVQIVLIDPAPTLDYYNRPNIYGYADDPARFIFLCRAALEYLKQKQLQVDILHLHDWHASIAAFLYKEIYLRQNQGPWIKKILLNLHNVGFQGLCSLDELERIGVDKNLYWNNAKVKEAKTGKLNLLQAGLNYSDKLVAVSHNYAEEILTPMGGAGLEPVFWQNKAKLTGLLNGIDYQIWNPETDVGIIANYSAHDSLEKIRQAKQQSKSFIQARFNLRQKEAPLIINIGRLAEQKAPEAILWSVDNVLSRQGQFIVLGSSLVDSIQKQFSEKQKQTAPTQDTAFIFEFNESLAHLLYAAA
ncbi:MAG: glycogen/starch synthase, partial [Parachlamydiales bacterium]